MRSPVTGTLSGMRATVIADERLEIADGLMVFLTRWSQAGHSVTLTTGWAVAPDRHYVA